MPRKNTDDELTPRVQEALGQLQHRMASLLSNHRSRWVLKTIEDLEALVKDHRAQCRNRGIKFPELVPIILVRQQAVEFYRRDLDDKAVQTVILNLTAKFPDVTAEELALGVGRAFPEYAKSRLNFEARTKNKIEKLILN